MTKLQTLPVFFVGFVLAACQGQEQQPKVKGEIIRDYASSLYNNQLYEQAVEQYNYYLANYDPDNSEAANLTYTIGNIYFERVHDYQNALSHYLKIKHLYPESEILDEVNKKMVACLERLQRSADAQQVLEEAALLEPSKARQRRPGEVIAKIGKRPITTGDLEYEISQLPPYVKSQLTDRSKKVDFLKQYIATELLYDTAKRKGLEKDKDVIEGAFQAKKNLMVQKLLEEEISQEVNVTESDIELYYKAHQEKYSNRDAEGRITDVKPLAEVRTQVMQHLIRQKQQEAYDVLVQRMMRAEAVEIYADKL
ncbi:MAG: tol-pal system YbgF family protein [bacterium]